MQSDTAVAHETRHSGASRAELVAVLDELHGVHNAVLHEMLLITAELDRRAAFLEDGHRDVAMWLQMHLGVGRRTATRWREAAERIGDLPHLAESFSSGRLSFDKLAACLSHATPENDEAVTREAEDLDISSCERVARRRRKVERSAEERAAASKKLTFSWADGRTRLCMYGSLPADEGATVMTALDRITDSLPLEDPEGNPTSRASRCADALVRLAATRIADDQDPDRAMVSIHVPLETLLGGAGVGEADCAFHEGGWMLHGDPDFELEFIKPTGEILHERRPSMRPATARWLWDDLLEGRFGAATEQTRPPPQRTLSLN